MALRNPPEPGLTLPPPVIAPARSSCRLCDAGHANRLAAPTPPPCPCPSRQTVAGAQERTAAVAESTFSATTLWRARARAWVRVAREAVSVRRPGKPGCSAAAAGTDHSIGCARGNQRRLDLVGFGATSWGGALCCDATMVSPLTREAELDSMLQAEGVEPAGARGLHAAAADLRETEFLAAFLDDLYVVTSPARASERLDGVTTCEERDAGVTASLGKTRVYSAAGRDAPPGIAYLGRRSGGETNRPLSAGSSRLGVPSGTTNTSKRKQPAVQRRSLMCCATCRSSPICSWILSAICAEAQHLLRNPPRPLPLPMACGALSHPCWATTIPGLMRGRSRET